MSKTSYREKWEKKLASYIEEGFVLFTDALDNDEKILIVTEENPNEYKFKEIDRIVKKYLLKNED
jgi:hypothetical protein